MHLKAYQDFCKLPESADLPKRSKQQQQYSVKKVQTYRQGSRLKQDHGSPLWIPEPNHFLDISYRRRGIDIGDVGIITEGGAFDFLFNICLSQDDPINAGIVPEGFSPLNPPLTPAHDFQGHQELGEDTDLSSESITKDISDVGPAYVDLFCPSHPIPPETLAKSGITFVASAREGAILTMPEGAFTVDLANTARFERAKAPLPQPRYRTVRVACVRTVHGMERNFRHIVFVRQERKNLGFVP
ncbi:hypothetical protein BDZ97DRAFT_1927593 [Flammula alnicola]|nr:hypothetical protein BDZ97DRAFT_1927593 [Flammula alnicola]